jgi:hypothetical protein
MTGIRSRQRGITVLGFLVLACAFGALGLAGIKLVPMYLNNMRLSKVLDDVQRELGGNVTTPNAILVELEKRFSIEDIKLPRDEVKITQVRDGYAVRIEHEARASYVANLSLLVLFEKQIEIKR